MDDKKSCIDEFNQHLHRLYLMENGLTNYSGGIHQQIRNCRTLLDAIQDNELRKKISELERFLLAIVQCCEIDDHYPG